MQTITINSGLRTQRDIQVAVRDALQKRFSVERHASKRLQALFGWCRSKAEKVLVGDTRITAPDLINLLIEMDEAFAADVLGSLTNGKCGPVERQKAEAIADLLEQTSRYMREQARNHEARFDDTC